jgi:hypothetical protein
MPQPEPAFLTICWQRTGRQDRSPVLVRATLCHFHRKQIALAFPDAHGRGQPGSSCDLCEGREPRMV